MWIVLGFCTLWSVESINFYSKADHIVCNNQNELAESVETISIPAIICAIDTTVIVACCVSLSIYPEVSMKLLQ